MCGLEVGEKIYAFRPAVIWQTAGRESGWLGGKKWKTGLEILEHQALSGLHLDLHGKLAVSI
jgi:hypothetical protein